MPSSSSEDEEGEDDDEEEEEEEEVGDVTPQVQPFEWVDYSVHVCRAE